MFDQLAAIRDDVVELSAYELETLEIFARELPEDSQEHFVRNEDGVLKRPNGSSVR